MKFNFKTIVLLHWKLRHEKCAKSFYGCAVQTPNRKSSIINLVKGQFTLPKKMDDVI